MQKIKRALLDFIAALAFEFDVDWEADYADDAYCAAASGRGEFAHAPSPAGQAPADRRAG